jgi:polysaccharide chain length determinant protein (PEP-CTERM system associated)
MDELLTQLITYLRGIWRRRWAGVGAAWLVGLIAAVTVLRMPDVYEATARVHVDTQSVLRPLLSGLAVQPNLDQQVSLVSRTLISRPNVERLIRMTDMDLRVTTPAEKEAMIESLQRTLKIGGIARDNLYAISYRDSSPDQAKRVVQSLLSIFVESSLGNTRKDTDTARRFIEEQIRQYEKRLEEAESRLKEFRLKNMHLMGADGRDYFARMATLSESLSSAKLELRAAEQSRDALKRELEGEAPAFLLPEAPAGAPGAPGSPPSELDARIESQKKGLDELLRRYTDQHPDVVGTRRLIQSLEDERKEELAARAKTATASGQRPAANTNPVIQQLKIALAESEANVASMRARVGELEARYTQLRAAARMQPELEAELTQLNRDYEIQKKQYENLVTRRESAAISGSMDATAGVADFRVIDPPIVSPKPVAPNRLLLLAGALAAALAAGVAASFLVSQVFPTVHDVRRLRELGGRPVLGSVTMLANPEVVRRRRRGTWLFAGGVASLVGAYGVAIGMLVWKIGI